MNKRIKSILIGCALTMLGACQVISGDRSVNQYSSDTAITTSVKTSLIKDAAFPASRVHVETDKGTVVLSGFVKTHAQKNKAGQLAIQVAGVRVVQNNLVVQK